MNHKQIRSAVYEVCAIKVVHVDLRLISADELDEHVENLLTLIQV